MTLPAVIAKTRSIIDDCEKSVEAWEYTRDRQRIELKDTEVRLVELNASLHRMRTIIDALDALAQEDTAND